MSSPRKCVEMDPHDKELLISLAKEIAFLTTPSNPYISEVWRIIQYKLNVYQIIILGLSTILLSVSSIITLNAAKIIAFSKFWMMLSIVLIVVVVASLILATYSPLQDINKMLDKEKKRNSWLNVLESLLILAESIVDKYDTEALCENEKKVVELIQGFRVGTNIIKSDKT